MTQDELFADHVIMSDLQAERERASFDSRALTYYLDGGKAATEVKERAMKVLESDQVFAHTPPDAPRGVIREQATRKFIRLLEHMDAADADLRRQLGAVIALAEPNQGVRLAIHYGLFMGALQSQAHPDLWAACEALNVRKLGGMIGCFGMTELGHGSNVAGIETTAVLDKSTDEFIIHTPSLSATKWWIGGAAQTATFCVVYAQLIVDGERHGVKTFLVQLRNMQTFEVLPGIRIGDCGSKMGRNGVDNGWIQFDRVRIPRTQMLMRHTHVAPDGTVRPPRLQQLSYGPLINGRVTIVNACADFAKMAVTVAVRYGVQRRQFSPRAGAPERQIIDYSTHKSKLMPLLACAYALHFGASETGHANRALTAALRVAKDAELDGVLSSLKEMHATAAGLKAHCTWLTLDLIERCRQSLGGNGYSAYAALGSHFQDFAVNVTWEGDNTILTLQAGRYLIQCCQDALRERASSAAGVAYMRDIGGLAQRRLAPGASVANMSALNDMLAVAAASTVLEMMLAFDAALADARGDADAAQQAVAARMERATHWHCMASLVARFHEAVTAAPSALQPVLGRLCMLFAAHTVAQQPAPLLMHGFLSAAHVHELEALVARLCDELRGDCVALTDAFNFSDWLLNTPLAAREGDLYNAYFEHVRNAEGRAVNARPPYYETVLAPFLQRYRPRALL